MENSLWVLPKKCDAYVGTVKYDAGEIDIVSSEIKNDKVWVTYQFKNSEKIKQMYFNLNQGG